MNAVLRISLLLGCVISFAASNSATAQLVISEFMATNVNTNIEDEDGAHSDWVEIQNTGTTSVSLNGWYLTDSTGDLRKWQFPTSSPVLTLAPGGRLLVWASGKDRKQAANLLHTNFSLNSSGGYLALVRPDGRTVEYSYPAYPPQLTDVSYGISGIGQWTVLAGPSLSTTWRVRVPQSASEFTNTMSGWNTRATFNASTWTIKGTLVFEGVPKGIGYDSRGDSGPHSFLINDVSSPNGNVASKTDVGATNVGMYIERDDPNFSTFVGTPTLCARTTFNVASPATIRQLRLNLRYDDGFIIYLNGTEILRKNAPAITAWNSSAPVDREDDQCEHNETFLLQGAQLSLVTGTNLLAIHGFNETRNSAHFVITPSLEAFQSVTNPGASVPIYLSSPTPGGENTIRNSSIGPDISQTTQNPPQPAGGAGSFPLLITSRVRQTLNPIATVTCAYRINFDAETMLQMKDDGTGGDVSAGDSIYSVQIPTSGLLPGHLLRWRIISTDSTGKQSTAPDFLDPLDNDQYFGTIARTPSIQSQLPVIYWFHDTFDDEIFPNGKSGLRSSLFYKLPGETSGRFYDNVLVNLHGQSTSGDFFKKKSENVNFNADNRFKWREGEELIRSMNLLSNWADKSHIRNSLAWETWNLTKHPSNWSQTVRVQQFTKGNADAGVDAQFLGLFDMVEDANKEFLERWGLDPNGALYKCDNNLDNALQNSSTNDTGVEKKTREWEDFTDLQALVNAMSTANSVSARRRWLYDNVDVPALINFLAVHNLIQNSDFGHKNYYVYRDTNKTKEWKILPWDQDLSFGHRWTSDQNYFDDDLDSANSIFLAGEENHLINIVNNSEATELSHMYLRRLRTLMDQYLGPPSAPVNHFVNRIDSYLDLLDPPNWPTLTDAERDFQKWGFWVDGDGETINASDPRSIYHRIRPSALRIKSANNTGIYPGANPYIAFGNIPDVHSSLAPFIPGRRAYLYTQNPTLNDLSIPAAQVTTPALVISDINFNPGGTDQEGEFFIIRNNSLDAVDLSGWQLTGVIDFTFPPGTVIPGQNTPTSDGSSANYVNQLVVARNSARFRARPVSPKGNEYRFVVGGYDRQLSARGGVIELRNPAGVQITSAAYAGAPTVSQVELRITELNYAPASPTAAESSALPGVKASDFEFIELINKGTASLNLSGAQFDRGITFVFPSGFTLAAGARTVIVSSQAAFTLRYGNISNVAGQFEGNLSNSGERLRLLDSVGEVVLDFTFSPSWYVPATRTGHTLIVTDQRAPDTAYNTAGLWRTSVAAGGSPGAAEPNVSAPIVTTLEATAITATTARLSATVNPNGSAATPEFIIAGARHKLTDIPAGNVPVTVTKDIIGLNPHSLYKFRAEATNLTGIGTGAELTLATLDRPPEAHDGESHFNIRTSIEIDVLALATDPDGDDLKIASVTPAQHGTVATSTDKKKVVYTPGLDYAGIDSFSYTISDGFGGEDIATLLLSSDAFEVWRWRKFGSAVDDPSTTSDLADPDHDGVLNLMEYAFGSEPMLNTSLQQLALAKVNGHLEITFRRAPQNTDLLYTIEAADSVTGPWSGIARSTNGGATLPLVAGVSANEADIGSLKLVRVLDDTSTQTGKGNRYWRVKIERK